MARVKRGANQGRRAPRKKYLQRTKGFFLTQEQLYNPQEAAPIAPIARPKRGPRRRQEREYRKLWIQRVGAAARNKRAVSSRPVNSRPIMLLPASRSDRKVLADIAG